MRTKIGITCMVLGAALIFCALSLFIYNQREAKLAAQAADELMSQLVGEIESSKENSEIFDPMDVEMTETIIDGYAYIGYLSIPNLELNLPIMADWDYSRLKIAPCRYSGTVKGEDFVIMAHNYKRHFGGISELLEGDCIQFTDMNGEIFDYEVVALDVLNPNAVEEMTAGEFDLTLFTCTYGGKSRITVYCQRI